MEFDKALNRAAALCSRSEQCESDVRAKLATWLDLPEQADEIIAHLKREGFIDEQRYARAYVHDKFLYNGWGRIKLRAMLRSKGIADDAILQAMEQIDETEYRNTLLRLLATKWRSVAGCDRQRSRAALLRFAASRGFEADLSYRCTNEVMSDNGED